MYEEAQYDESATDLITLVAGPIPLHRYRAFKRTKSAERADRIRSLADQLGLPIAALAGDDVRLAAAGSL